MLPIERVPKERIGAERFFEIHLDAPVDVCEARDAALFPNETGIYAQARAGKIRNFTGLTAPYEKPTTPALSVDSNTNSVDETVSQILFSSKHRVFSPRSTEFISPCCWTAAPLAA